MKTFFIFLIISLPIYSQQSKSNILIAKYSLYPYSSTFFNHDSNTPAADIAFDIALRRTKEFKYTLISNFQSNLSVFYLDTIITTPIKGKEEFWIEPEDVIKYAYTKDNVFKKNEVIFNIPFFSQSQENDMEFNWTITDETKEIAGYRCSKALIEIKNNKIIAWFTTEIPINYGPMNLRGLPGFILQAEDFFTTISIESVTFSDNKELLSNKINQLSSQYISESQKNEIKESIFLIKKSELIQQLKSMMN